MHALDVLGDPIRRRLLELMGDEEVPAGDLARVVGEEFGVSQPAVSQHLRTLRENGFAAVRPEGARRLYRVRAAALEEADLWLDAFRAAWAPRLAALDTEIARGKRSRRDDPVPPAPSPAPSSSIDVHHDSKEHSHDR